LDIKKTLPRDVPLTGDVNPCTKFGGTAH